MGSVTNENGLGIVEIIYQEDTSDTKDNENVIKSGSEKSLLIINYNREVLQSNVK